MWGTGRVFFMGNGSSGSDVVCPRGSAELDCATEFDAQVAHFPKYEVGSMKDEWGAEKPDTGGGARAAGNIGALWKYEVRSMKYEVWMFRGCLLWRFSNAVRATR